MSRVVTVEANPRSPTDGTVQTIGLAGGGRDRGYYYDGQHWQAGMAQLPRFAAELKFDDSGWSGGTSPQIGELIFRPADTSILSAVGSYYWRDAPITIKTRDELAGDATVELSGTVATLSVADGAITIGVADLSKAIDKSFLGRFAGTGGIEGGAEAADRVKRRSWGRVFNVEGRILDKANDVYEFGDPAYPWQQFDALRDKGREGPYGYVAWQGTAAATLAALAAAVPERGGGMVAPSIACAKWWTQPSGPLTADIRGESWYGGYVETAPEIASRIVAASSALAITNVAAMAAIRPDVAGLHVESETAAQALDRLLLGVSLLWVLEPAGAIRLAEWTLGDPVETVRSLDVSRQASYAPTRTRRIGYRRNHRLHSDGEISAALYIGDAGEILYGDGSTVEAYKPAEPGADVTGSHTANDTANVAGVPAAELVDNVVSTRALLETGGEIADAIARIRAATREGAPNLIVNSDFRDGLAGWTDAGGGWVVVQGYPVGPFAECAIAGSGLYRDVNAFANVDYSLSFEADPDGGGGIAMHVEWRTDSATISDSETLAAGDNWDRGASGLLHSPAGTTTARLWIYNATTAIGRITRAQFQQGAATAWNAAATDWQVAARITTEEETRYGETSALAGRAATIEAQVAGTEDSGLKAAIIANATAAADATAAVAEVGTILTARPISTGNLLTNTDFATDALGWQTYTNVGSISFARDEAGDSWRPVPEHNLGLYQSDAAAGAVGIWYQDVPVTAGEWYAAAANVAAHRAQVLIGIEFYDASNEELDHSYNGYLAVGTGGAVLTAAAWNRPWVKALAPTGTKYARFVFFKGQTNTGETDSFAWLLRPTLALAHADQAVTPPYSPGSARVGLQDLKATVSEQAGVLADATGKLVAYVKQVASVPGADAAVILQAVDDDGNPTSSVALLGKKLLFLLEGDDDPDNAILGMEFVLVDGVPTLKLHGNLQTDGAVSTNNLEYGTTGEAAVLYDTTGVTFNSTSWTSVADLTLTPSQGQPIKGTFTCVLTDISGGSTDMKCRILRDDGTAVWGGSGGLIVAARDEGESLSAIFFDSVDAARATTYNVEMCKTPGHSDTVRADFRSFLVEEMTRTHFQSISLAAASGEGPGRGPGGGGNINGGGYSFADYY